MLPGSVQKVCGGGGGRVLKPISVFNFDQKCDIRPYERVWYRSSTALTYIQNKKMIVFQTFPENWELLITFSKT